MSKLNGIENRLTHIGRASQPSRELLDRAPPHDEDAERGLLCALLLDGDLFPKAREIVRSTYFYAPVNRHIWEAIGRVHDAGLKPDQTLVIDELKAAGHYQSEFNSGAGGIGPADLIALFELHPNPGNWHRYAAIVAEKAVQRQIFNAGLEFIRLAHSPPRFDDGVAGMVAEAQRVTQRISAVGDLSSAMLTCLADVQPVSTQWLWPGRVPVGRITMLVGRPGQGKSFLTLDMAARVSSGADWPDGEVCPRGSVLLLTAEDDLADTIVPRLMAHRADTTKIRQLTAVKVRGDSGARERMARLCDLPVIESALKTLGDCRLLVVDPIGEYMGGRVNAHRDNEVRGVLAPVAHLASQYGVAVLVVAHRRKAAVDVADDSLLGSVGFGGLARAIWHLSRDPEDRRRRLLLPGKNNLSPEGLGLGFSIIGDPPALSWEADPVDMTADEALAAERAAAARNRGRPADEQDQAEAFLRSELAGGERLAAELLNEAINRLGISQRTLNRAKKNLGIEPFRKENPGPWWWRLEAG